jgi:hypothetical protein
MPIAFTAERSSFTKPARRRFEWLTFPVINHHATLGKFFDRGAATSVAAALRLSSVDTN